MVLFNRGDFKRAQEEFSKLVSYFPEERELVAKAELKMADCAFMRKEYEEARERYSEFLKRYPLHPDVPYAQFQMAMSYFRQIRPEDRDQEATRKALEAFEEVMRRYPGTILAEKAKEKAAFCRRRLAEHELYVAKFYLRKGKEKAALGRALAALRIEGSGLEDECLYLLAVIHRRLGNREEALRYLEALEKGYPSSPYLKEAHSLKEDLLREKAS